LGGAGRGRGGRGAQCGPYAPVHKHAGCSAAARTPAASSSCCVSKTTHAYLVTAPAAANGLEAGRLQPPAFLAPTIPIQTITHPKPPPGSYLHSRGFVHGDLRSPNLFVASDGRLKIGDFGFCQLLPPEVQKVGPAAGPPAVATLPPHATLTPLSQYGPWLLAVRVDLGEGMMLLSNGRAAHLDGRPECALGQFLAAAQTRTR
jgi:hypothetical protein